MAGPAQNVNFKTNQVAAYHARAAQEKAMKLSGGFLDGLANRLHFTLEGKTSERLILDLGTRAVRSYMVSTDGVPVTYAIFPDERSGVWHFLKDSHWLMGKGQHQEVEHAVIDGLGYEVQATLKVIEYDSDGTHRMPVQDIGHRALALATEAVGDVNQAIVKLEACERP